MKEEDAIQAARDFNSNPAVGAMQELLGRYLSKMIETQGPFALDAYLVTVLGPLVNSIPLGQEEYLNKAEIEICKFIKDLVEVELEFRRGELK